MKRLFYFSAIFVLLSIFSCDIDRKQLVVTINQVVSESETAGLASRDTEVSFLVSLAEDDEFSGYYSIYDSDGALCIKNSISENGIFSYTFDKADTFFVTARVKTSRFWGEGNTEIEVSSSLNVPVWSLSNQSIIGGETGAIELTDLDYERIDVRIINSDTGTTAFYEENTSGTVTYTTRSDEYGNFNVYVTVYDAEGNRATVSDQLIILNPNDPIEILLEATENNPDYADTIKVTGSVSSPNPIESIILERTCYYGREEGISPLAEPKTEGGVDYTKTGQDLIARVETYVANAEGSPLLYDEATETFSFIDPMPYHNKSGNIEELNFKWDYAKFDREAWKYIKRNKSFDMERALSVDYRILAESSVSNGQPVGSATVSGYPYLSTQPLGEFGLWLSDTALNRLFVMQVPRYCWDKTVAWVAGVSTTWDIPGVLNGYAKLQKTGMTQGWGRVYNYSDFTGIVINTTEDLSMDVSLDADNKRLVGYKLLIKTPLYPDFNFDLIDLGVRDYGRQWGMWVDDLEELTGASGRVEIRRKGSSTVETLDTDTLLSIHPHYAVGVNLSRGGANGYDAEDYAGILAHDYDGKTIEPTLFSKINYMYPPTGTPAGTDQHPLNTQYGNWSHRGPDWQIHYEYK